MRRLLAALLILLLLPLPALAGSGTLAVKDASGTTQTFEIGTLGGGQYFSLFALCDGAACANLAAINASGQLAIQAPPSLPPLAAGSNTIGAVNQAGTWAVALSAGSNTVGNVDILGNAGASLDAPLAAATAPSNGLAVICQYNFVHPSLTSGQTAAVQCDSTGRPEINVTASLPTGSNTIGAVTQASGPWTINVTQFGGATVATGTGASGSGIPRVTVSNDSQVELWDGTNTASVKAASTPPATTDKALVVAQSPNSLGCAGQSIANTNFTPFSFASTTAQRIVTGSASKQTYICAINITAPNTNVALIEGTTTTNPCDTGTAGLAGGTTAATGWNFANGTAPGVGLVLGDGRGIVLKTATAGDHVCLLASAANQVSGTIVWVQF